MQNDDAPRYDIDGGKLVATVPLRGFARGLSLAWHLILAGALTLVGAQICAHGDAVALIPGLALIGLAALFVHRRNAPRRVTLHRGSRWVHVATETGIRVSWLRDAAIRFRAEPEEGGARGVVTVGDLELTWTDVRPGAPEAERAAHDIACDIGAALDLPVLCGSSA